MAADPSARSAPGRTLLTDDEIRAIRKDGETETIEETWFRAKLRGVQVSHEYVRRIVLGIVRKGV
jgi:hypothetical protein